MKITIVIALLSVSALAAPFGTITCAIGTTADFRVVALNAADGTLQVLATSATNFTGLDGAALCGDPCVVGRCSAAGAIAYLYRDGSFSNLVPQTAAGTNLDPCIALGHEYVAYVQRNASRSNEDVLHVVNGASLVDTPVYTTKLWGVDLAHPRFSPDGSNLVFALDDDFWGSRDVYVMPRAGGIPQELEALPDNAMHPCYAANGRLLACVAPYAGSFAPYVANADGTNPQRINLGGQFALFPCFSPCSRYLAVASDNGINIIDLTNDTVLTQLPLDYDGYVGLAWHLGAQCCTGVTKKAAAKATSVTATALDMPPPSLPQFGAFWLDNVFIPFDNPALWLDKHGKKFVYNDKTLKYKATYTIKTRKLEISARKLALLMGGEYRTGMPVRITFNLGARTFTQLIELNKRGTYKKPK